MKTFKVALIGLMLFSNTAAVFAQSKSVSYTMSVTIPPLFELSVSGPPNDDIAFGVVPRNAASDVTAESAEVTLTARSNLGRPYQITQALVSPLANENNESFSDQDITVSATNLQTDGVSANHAVVSTAPATLFTSNAQGKSDTVKANYRLRVRPEQPSGNYQTKLIYTITAF